MSYGLTNTVPPAEEPVSFAEAKTHLNVTHAEDDPLIGTLVAAAREQTETETGRRWMPQTVTLSLQTFPYRDDQGCGFASREFVGQYPGFFPVILLPLAPASAVNAVRYYDGAGVLQTLAVGTDYLSWLAHCPPIVYPAPGRIWPLTQVGRLGAVEVEFVAGYANASAVPAAAKAAMLLAVGLWYEHRGDSEDPTEMGLPPAALRLLRGLHTGHYS